MGFSTHAPKIWPITPDWSTSVRESLSWRSEIMQANATGVTQHRGLRVGPRRSFVFSVSAASQERRVADMLLAGHSGTWQLPIWPDVHWLETQLASASEVVPVATAGRDFVAGGRAVLYSSVNRWELIDVLAVEATQIVLSQPTSAVFGPGDRLYPVRRAKLQKGAEERLGSDDFGRRTLTFDVVEPCDWPLLSDPPTYLGHLILGVRPDESVDPSSSYARLELAMDYETSFPVVHDLARVGLRAQQTHWKLAGREQHTWFRSLLYSLDGRRVPAWLPSWASDLLPKADVTGGATALRVEWAGYQMFGIGKPNRKDLRIELIDGTVFYRRILDAAPAGGTEILTLDAPLADVGIAAEHIRQISFMALSTLASDEIEIDHITDADGLATATTGWNAVVPDV